MNESAINDKISMGILSESLVLHELLSVLTSEEVIVIASMYGLCNFECKSDVALSKMLGKSRKDVFSIKKQALHKLKDSKEMQKLFTILIRESDDVN